MSAFDFGTIDPDVKDGTDLAADLNAWRDAVNSNHSAAVRPAYLPASGTWVQKVSATIWHYYLWDGTVDHLILSVNPATGAVLNINAFGRNAANLNAGTIPAARVPQPTQAEAEAGANNTKFTTPLRVKEAILALTPEGVTPDLLAAKLSSIVTGPAANWTNASDAVNTTELIRSAIAEADLITDDPDFGHCYAFPSNNNETFGHAFPVPYHDGDVIEVEVSYKVVTDSVLNGGINRIMLGITSQQGFTQIETNVQTLEHTATVADGVQTIKARFATRVLPDFGGWVGSTPQVSAGNLAYFQIRQNPAAVSDGLIRVGHMLITNVTAQVDAEEAAVGFKYNSASTVLALGSTTVFAHGFNASPSEVRLDMQCVVAIAGYNSGDLALDIAANGATVNPLTVMIDNGVTANVRVMIPISQLRIMNKSTRNFFDMTAAHFLTNFRFIVRANP